MKLAVADDWRLVVRYSWGYLDIGCSLCLMNYCLAWVDGLVGERLGFKFLALVVVIDCGKSVVFCCCGELLGDIGILLKELLNIVRRDIVFYLSVFRNEYPFVVIDEVT